MSGAGIRPRLRTIIPAAIFLIIGGCVSAPTRTILMVEIPHSECSISRTKALIAEFRQGGAEPLDVGSSFKRHGFDTYVYAKLRERQELLLVNGSHSGTLLLSLIGKRKPSYLETLRHEARSIASSCS